MKSILSEGEVKSEPENLIPPNEESCASGGKNSNKDAEFLSSTSFVYRFCCSFILLSHISENSIAPSRPFFSNLIVPSSSIQICSQFTPT